MARAELKKPNSWNIYLSCSLSSSFIIYKFGEICLSHRLLRDGISDFLIIGAESIVAKHDENKHTK